MSGNTEDDKPDPGKVFPLDLARNQIATVKTLDGKTPIVMTGQPLRNMRVLAQATPASGQVTVAGPTSAIITTSIVPQAVLKQGDGARNQISSIINTTQQQPSSSSGNITLQRPAQLSLSTTVPIVAQNISTGTTYHVPRGPAVVANLAAPRSNVATSIRAPMVVAAQTSGQAHAFVRPPRTPSPAQATTWLSSSSTAGTQIKGAPTVLTSPVRGTSVAGIAAAGNKPHLVARTQSVTQSVSSIRPTTAAILHSAITIGQAAQIHSLKPGQGAAGIQTLGNTVTIAQVIPPRTQALVYGTAANTQFGSTPRLTVASSVQNQKQVAAGRPVVTTARITVPINVNQTNATRLITPQGNVTTSARISTTQSSTTGTTPARIIPTTQSSVTLGRLSVTIANQSQAANAGILAQPRISTLSLHSLVAVASSQPRALQTQSPKVITQPAPGTAIHLTQMPASIKTTQAVTTSTRTIVNVQPAALVTQRQGTVVSSQTIPIAKVYQQQGDPQQGNQAPTNVFIHAPVASVPCRTSPSTSNTTQTNCNTSTVTTYSIASGTYIYDTNYTVARSFNQQPTSFAAIQQSSQQIRPASIGTQVHGIVTNQPVRFNQVMVLDQNRAFVQENTQEHSQQSVTLPKVTSSPRPSILRKRDHEGSPLKAAKNLTPVLSNIPQPPSSPPSRPDSRGNGHSSGGSTTISATSSPGLAEGNDDSLPHAPVNIKEEEDTNRPPTEMSPRKKPRKQQLTGNDIDEHNDDMEFLSESNIKKEQDSDDNHTDGPRDGAPDTKCITTVRKPASASLLNCYRQTWKATHNHYMRYSDVRPKDERRPTIMDLANQCRVLEKVNGWKIHHLSTQMEDLADQEQSVYTQLTDLLKYTEAEEDSNFEKELNQINELIKGNLQRIKIINDGMIEAKTQMMKIFDHKSHVTDIISRCASKRNFKKREKV